MVSRRAFITGGGIAGLGLLARLYFRGDNPEIAQTTNAKVEVPKVEESHSQIPIQEKTLEDISSIEDNLTRQYGENTAKYALQIVDNGRRIRESPDKEKYLGGIEQKLREKFPLIKPPRLFGFTDEPREAENVAMLYAAREKVLTRAKKDGIDIPINLIIAALSNEGFSLDVDRTEASYQSGFMMYGLDTFGSEFNHIVERGYLPASFKSRFTVSEHINEAGRRVKSANFTKKQDAYEAFVATLAHRQYLFLEDLRKNKIPRSEIPKEQVLFFTYKYYNGGPNSAEGLLRKKSVKEIDRFFKRVMTYGSTGNAYVVLAGAQWLELSGAVDPRPQGKYWWSK